MIETTQQLDTAVLAAIKPEPTDCNRCGACCEQLPLNLPREEFKAYRSAVEQGETYYFIDGSRKVVDPRVGDWFLHLEIIDPPTFGSGALRDPEGEEADVDMSEIVWLKCNHFTRDSKDLGVCGIYNERPYVCREYKPGSQGGILRHKQMIVYKNCSYLLDHDWEAEQQRKASGGDIIRAAPLVEA